MSEIVEVYGTKIVIPEYNGFIQDWGTDNIKKQYWKRPALPDFMLQVDYDKDGNALLNQQQREFAQEEVRRCKEGFVFLNNGVKTYITGKNYFYLQWWKLEDDIYPDYRDIDRRYFLFLHHWENIPYCLGVIRGKKRREGATSVATSNLIYECIFFKNSFCGLTSKSLIDAKSAFTNMVSFGYRQLPVFLKPKQLNNKDSVSELVFAHKSVEIKGGRGGIVDTDTGHRSRVDYRAPSLNAYDSGRISRATIDEGSKWAKEVPFSTFISIVSKTLVKGVRKVGFLECPSTTNSMDNGGEEFKLVWDNANQFKYEKTPNRLVKYLTSAYDGYVGFIDKHGMSVIDKPTEEQYKYLVENFVGIGDLTEEDVKLGAKEYLLNRRKLLSGALLEEEIRMNPFDEEEMFMYAGAGCEFNAENIQNQKKALQAEPVYLRQCRLITKSTLQPNGQGKMEWKEQIDFMDDEKGGWFLYEKPNKPNHFKKSSVYYEPLNTMMYQIGIDTTQDDRIAGQGSCPAICVFKKSCIVDGVEMGLYPVAMWISPTRLDIHFDEEVLKACKWYGCKANYENDKRTDFIFYFNKEKCAAFLNWTPTVFQNPSKKGGFKPEIGSRSGDPFQLSQQLQILKKYIDGVSNDVYDGHVHRIVYPTLLDQLLKYNHSDRTKSDQVISLVMALAPVLGEMEQPIIPQRTKQIIPTYKLNYS
jgi:hypothetical protein